MDKNKVVLGMSGGVDSSVAAHLLKNQGYEVYGFFMNANFSGKSKLMSCIDWNEEEKMVKRICEELGIKLFVFDCEKGYEKNVIGQMIRDYEKGLTPNPDTLCNKIGKFPQLLNFARETGAEYIATGHYACIRRKGKEVELLMGKDRKKDQSYFLAELNQETLKRTLFPLGELTKKEVRALAQKLGFPNWDKRSSRGICYLGKIDMKKFLHENIPEKKGEVILPSGKVVGTHPGIMYFTIGEKVGEGKGVIIDKKLVGDAGARLYVAGKLLENKLVVAPAGDKALKTSQVFVKDFHWIGREVSKGLKARIRHLGELYSGKLKKQSGKWVFVFDKGVEGVAEGQLIVLYRGDVLAGGGEIQLR